ncbi:MAG TPA: DUF882 domain-containing protein [Vicinamibacteria bacterium]|nr:DUF882 domain-containing protein [Vicinamibacteria bacterium]
MNETSRRRFLGGLASFSALALARPSGALPTREERVLSFFNTHTSESLTLPYFADGAYLGGALSRLERFLRDHRTGQQHPIDPALFDLLHELRRATSAKSPFQVISCYRSPATNAMLRTTGGGGVAGHSMHIQGRAIDVRVADVSTTVLRDAARELGRGGVGYYRDPDFVHVDTGRVRTW